MGVIMNKICKLCGKEKDVSFYHRNSKSKDGLHSYCKDCNAQKAKIYNSTAKGKDGVRKAQQKQYSSGYFKFGKGAISNMSKSAEMRGHAFNLTESDLSQWWHETPNVCFYCGIGVEDYIALRNIVIEYSGVNWEILRFKRFFEQDVHAKISDMTIDRKNNAIGYEIDNICKSCWFCNSLKSDFYTEKEMSKIGLIIISNLKEVVSYETKESV